MTKGQYMACCGIVGEMVQAADDVKLAMPILTHAQYLKFVERMRCLRVLLAAIEHERKEVQA